jgi:hypothetical protein
LLPDFLLLGFELYTRGLALSLKGKISLEVFLLALPCANLGPNNYDAEMGEEEEGISDDEMLGMHLEAEI